jgi:hypothetical protein
MDEIEPNPPHEPDAPEKLAEALRRTEAGLFVPPSVDVKVLAQAREHFVGVRPRPSSFRGMLVGLAAAACVMSGVWLFLSWQGEEQRKTVPAAFSREDVDRSGGIDILDAMALARLIERGSASAGFDFNGDGVIDRRDVELLAARAVDLERGGAL